MAVPLPLPLQANWTGPTLPAAVVSATYPLPFLHPDTQAEANVAAPVLDPSVLEGMEPAGKGDDEPESLKLFQAVAKVCTLPLLSACVRVYLSVLSCRPSSCVMCVLLVCSSVCVTT